jgi:outer membrane biosynthesis protein TonB
MDTIGVEKLFSGNPELRITYIEAIKYPPLARQTRISGTVILKVFVSHDGQFPT